MSKWYWHVRVCRRDGYYAFVTIPTEQNPGDIIVIKDFYESLTGGKFLIESMINSPPEVLRPVIAGFDTLWIPKGPHAIK